VAESSQSSLIKYYSKYHFHKTVTVTFLKQSVTSIAEAENRFSLVKSATWHEVSNDIEK
jgi:hypothetical protein